MIGRGVRHMAKRGRPKSARRIEQEKQDADFRKSIKFDESEMHDQVYEQSLSTRAQAHIANWREQYGNGILIPVAAYVAMGMMREFGAFKGKEALIEALYKRAQLAGAESQQAGTEGVISKSIARSEYVWHKKINADLRAKIKKDSRELNKACKKIVDEWDKRGDMDKKPTTRTVRSWYNLVSPQI